MAPLQWWPRKNGAIGGGMMKWMEMEWNMEKYEWINFPDIKRPILIEID